MNDLERVFAMEGVRRPARPWPLLWIGILGLAGLGGVAPAAWGHPLAPALLELREQAGGVVDVRFKTTLVARSRQAAAQLAPLLPEICEPGSEVRSAVVGTGRVERWTLRCTGSLVGRVIGVAGLRENAIDALLRVELADGRVLARVLRAGRPTVSIPARPGQLQVLASYLELGARHIFGGLDHLLFVFGLVLLVAAGRGYGKRLLITLTAFTAGHCVTLSLAAMGWLRLPAPLVELAISLSVLLLAVELARGSDATRRRALLPWALAGGFGFLHGLGFAAALVEAGLPEGEILLALLSFNLGIEVGQVAFVAIVLSLRLGLGVIRGERAMPAWTSRAPVYGMGCLAAMWCIERGFALFR